MTVDVTQFNSAMGGGVSPTLYEFVPHGNEPLKYLIQKVHISFTTATDNVMDRIIKMTILENEQFDAFQWLIAISGATQLNADLKVYSKSNKLIKTFPVGYKIDHFNTTFDWNKPDTIMSWNVTGRINFIS